MYVQAAQQIADGEMCLEEAIENIPELKNVADLKQRKKKYSIFLAPTS